MLITQLRIAGFKSFVDPTDVPIEPGLTGIVGPNGCGKSNLLESLRWVMGASSAKAMRGGEMDDLIFSGSADRPARELAEVTLVLDNSDRKAPPEFNASDVLEIVRRLKRGAGSTYKLNGRTVRGKDVQLLFADASTGANSPSLVRQGQISELIASKPQNRRRILEEAAGIAGLNTRRHESELKLKNAEANLERLSEVSAEVERQLESLKRQARKARKYQALSDEITALEAYALHLKWEAARQASDGAQAALAQARLDVEQLTRDDAIAEKVRLEADQARAPLREMESIEAAKLGQTKIALAKLATEHKNAAETVKRIEADLDRISGDMTREQTLGEEAETAAEAARKEIAALPVEDPQAGAVQEAEARAALERAQAQVASAEAAADEANRLVAETKARREAAEANLSAQRKRELQLKLERDRLKRDHDGLPNDDDLKHRVASAQSDEDAAIAAAADADRVIETAEADLAAARDAENAAAPPRDEADKALRAIEAEIAGLERLLRRAEGPKAAPVLEHVRTDPGYERAVAAALGDDLQASLDPAAPLKWAGAPDPDQALPADIAPLTRFTNAPAELAARLGQCGLVTAEQGDSLSAHLKPGQRLVSVEGHLWRWDGFRRTPDAPLAAAERLEQQARLEDLEAEAPNVRDRLTQAQAALDAAKTRRAEAEGRVKTAQARRPALAKGLADIRARAAEAKQALDRAAMKRESAEAALTRAETDLRAVDETLALLAGDVGDDELPRLETALAEDRAAVAEARKAESEARGQLNDLTRGREQAKARRDGLERDLAAWLKRASASAERMTGLIERREAARTSLVEAKDAPASMQAELDRLATEEARLEQARAQAADRFADAERAYREAENAARAASNAASGAREALARGQASVDSTAQRLEELVETAKAQFQRAPEGLKPLAQAGLDVDAMETLDAREADRRADEFRRQRDALGGVNMEAESEAADLAERLGSQETEKADLTGAIAKLREGVDALNKEGRDRLMAAFDTVNAHFKALFTALFRGGQAELRLVDADDPLAAGLEIFAQPPGKRLGTLSLMSGGEQALTATALIFAVFLSNPAPICVLDEVDAPLDDANVDRFCRMLDEMRTRTDTRFVVITHNPVTMSRMDRLFGVTMREKGVSKLVSVDLNAAEQMVAAE